MTGVATVVVQGGQVPEFQVQPDPAKLVATAVTVPGILDAIGRSNMIDSPGLIESNHELVRWPGHRADAHAGEIVEHRRSRPRLPGCRCASATWARSPFGDARVHYRHCEREAGGAAECLPAAGQQHRRAWPMPSTGEIDQIRQNAAPGVELQPFYDQSEMVNDSITSVRDAILIGLILASIIWCCSCGIGAPRWWPAW